MTKEDMDKYRVLASESRYRSALRWLSTIHTVDWSEVRDFVSAFVLPDQMGGEFTFLLTKIRAWEMDGMQPSAVPDLTDLLRTELAKKWNSLDALSVVGASVPPLDEGESFPFVLLSRSYWLAPFQGDGGYLTITGRPRTGKTGIGCHYIDMCLQENPASEVLTNIPLEVPVQNVRPVSAFSELLDGIADSLEAERPWMWELDEAGLVWLRAEAMTAKARGLEKFARIVPKLYGSFIFIEQRQEGIPSVIQDFAQSHILCTTPGFVIADLPARRTAVRSIPKPRVKYRSGETGYFEVDVDIEDLLRALPERGAATQAERIRRFLESTRPEVSATIRPSVTCIWCGESWIPRKDSPPDRCPRCLRRHPLGAEEEPPPPASQVVP